MTQRRRRSSITPRVKLASALLLASIAAAAHAATAITGLATQLLTVAASLAVVIALIFGCAWLVRRFGITSRMVGQQVRTVASLNVGTRERVLLVEANGVQLLLGVAPGSVRALHCFAADDTGNFAGTLRAERQGQVLTAATLAGESAA